MATETHIIHITDPAGIGLLLAISLLFLGIRLLPRYLAGKASYVNTAQAAIWLQQGNWLFLDVRTPYEFYQSPGHIPDSSNQALAQLAHELKNPVYLQYIKEHKGVLLICQSGMRASIAAYLLRRHIAGSVYVLSGGIEAWEDAGLPLQLD